MASAELTSRYSTDEPRPYARSAHDDGSTSNETPANANGTSVTATTITDPSSNPRVLENWSDPFLSCDSSKP